jgi:hypothetical protein
MLRKKMVWTDSRPPERQHLVGERIPDRERFTLRLDPEVLAPVLKNLVCLTGRRAVDIVHGRDGRRGCAWGEAQSVGNRPQRVQNFRGASSVAPPGQPGHHEKGGFLRDRDAERSSVEQVPQFSETIVSYEVAEQQSPNGSDAKSLREGKLVRLEGVIGRRSTGGESAA